MGLEQLATKLAEPGNALSAVTVLTAIGHLLTGSQVVAARRLFDRGAPLDWQFVQQRYPVLRGLLPRAFPWALSGGWFTTAAALTRCASALAILGWVWAGWSPLWPMALLVAANAAITIHLTYGDTTADRLGNVIAMALLMAFSVGTERAATFGLVFIAAISCLSYATAGIAKLGSPTWRDGTTLSTTFSTEMFGHAGATRASRRWPPLAATLSRMVIAFEVLFPLVIIAPLDLAIAGLVAGLVFHLSVALLMGLNTFVWMCGATYPAILFVNLMLR